MKRVTTTCVLGLALSCGGHIGHRQRDGQAGAPSTDSVAGAQSTDSIAGARATESQAGAWIAGGGAGFQATDDDTVPPDAAGGALSMWVPRDGFDELPLGARPDADRGIHFAVDALGDIYLATESTTIDSSPAFDLSRVSADGRNNWTQRIKGESYSLTVDAAGTVYQSRKLNGVGVLDKRSADGRWLWSNEVEVMTLHLGRDGALYGAAWGERLRKFDDEGNVLWTWQGPGQRGVSGFGADASGTVFVRSGVTPSAQLPSGAKGQSAPQDGLLFTLDQSGVELSQRRYSTGVYEPTSPVAVVYLETGPVNFAVTSAGQLLSASLTGTGLFDPSGDAAWQWDARNVKPSAWELSSGFSGALAAGRCGHCASSVQALYAFDDEGNQSKTLILHEYTASAWAADNVDNIYALVRYQQTVAVRRYHGESGWSDAEP